MKKIALTSLIAMFAFAGAHAANVIDGNPLYMPKAGHFYSVTGLASHTEGSPYTLSENFGYGITDRLAVEVGSALRENRSFDVVSWKDFELNATFRALNMGAWKLDAVAAYGFDMLYNHPKAVNGEAWFDEDETDYTWKVGVRGGYASERFTIAGKALFSYENTESFNWNEDAGAEGIHKLTLGVDAQYVLCPHLSLVGGAEYTGRLDSKNRGSELAAAKIKDAGVWKGEVGVNYNIDATKFVGAYINGSLNHNGGDKNDEWEWDDGFGFGLKFGIDF